MADFHRLKKEQKSIRTIEQMNNRSQKFFCSEFDGSAINCSQLGVLQSFTSVFNFPYLNIRDSIFTNVYLYCLIIFWLASDWGGYDGFSRIKKRTKEHLNNRTNEHSKSEVFLFWVQSSDINYSGLDVRHSFGSVFWCSSINEFPIQISEIRAIESRVIEVRSFLIFLS